MSAPRLTIGLACSDDFDGVYFTLTSLMVHHREAMPDCRLLVVDNHPGSRQGRQVREWMSGDLPHAEYRPFPAPFGTAPARNEVFRGAQTECVLCLDCHVLIAPGGVRRLLDYYAAHPQTNDLLTGPLLSDSGDLLATHQRPEWSGGAWGVWDADERGLDPHGSPFEIWQQGMGLFSCRKDAWVGFHSGFRGFGGCESYVMEKVRRGGAAVLCCPWLRWTHRFPRPGGPPYRASRADALNNYLLGFQELGIDQAPATRHFASLGIRPRKDSCHTSPDPEDRSVVIVGNPDSGAAQMRGGTVARHLGCAFIHDNEIPAAKNWDVAVIVKHGGREMRRRAARLIYDPLDAFWDATPGNSPEKFWREKYDELHFDDILATSPACEATMRDALPPHVGIHLLPHPADDRICADWSRVDGPVVYAGDEQFVASGLERIREACRQIGREFVSGWSCETLRGAGLVLALRLPPFDDALNRHCKPQIKIANALAAGAPVVTTDCPAAVSLYPGLATVPTDFTASQLAAAMREAIRERQSGRFTRIQHYLAAIDRLLHRPARVVYTAIFGGSDALREPSEMLPGVQYVCFTDNPRLQSRIWRFHRCPASSNPLMQARACKILSHDELDCDESLWIDGSRELHRLNGVFDHLSAEIGLPRHPEENCIYLAAERCKESRRGDPDRIDRAMARYRAEAHPPLNGVWDSGVIARRHTEAVRQFNREWWNEVQTGTPRDQLSLPVVLRRLEIPFETLPEGIPESTRWSHAR